MKDTGMGLPLYKHIFLVNSQAFITKKKKKTGKTQNINLESTHTHTHTHITFNISYTGHKEQI